MANFNEAFALTMGEEGGYANHPSDKGGQTYKGITRRDHPNWPGWKVVDRITAQTNNTDRINQLLANEGQVQDSVRALYKAQYWDVNRLDNVANQSIANEMFDTGVNMGTGTVARFAQQALGLLTGTSVAVDGQIGIQTLTLLNGFSNQLTLLRVMNALQGERYLNLIRKDASQRVFAKSWFGRVFRWTFAK